MQRPGHRHPLALGATFRRHSTGLHQLGMVGMVSHPPMRAAGFHVGVPDFAHGHSLHGSGGLAGGFGGLLLALHFAGVCASVQGHAQAVCFLSGGFNGPGANIPDGAADGLPVQFGLEHECLNPGRVLCAGGCRPHAQAWGLAIAQEHLQFFGRASQALDCASRQVLRFAQVRRIGLFRSCHRVPLDSM